MGSEKNWSSSNVLSFGDIIGQEGEILGKMQALSLDSRDMIVSLPLTSHEDLGSVFLLCFSFLFCEIEM